MGMGSKGPARASLGFVKMAGFSGIWSCNCFSISKYWWWVLIEGDY
jgi:hypothetical protein